MPNQPKIPTLLGILIILLIIGAVSFFVDRQLKIPTSASASSQPKNIFITNLSDTNGTVVWQTDSPSTGMVVLQSPDGKKISAFDERDVTGKMGQYLTHSVTVKSLTPNTTYSIRILSQGKTYTQKTSAYELKTGPPIPVNDPQLFEPAYGTVVTSDGQPGASAILTFRLTDGQLLSTLVKQSGSWVIPLHKIRTSDLTSFVPTTEKRDEIITVYLQDQKAEAWTDTDNDSPVPDIVMGTSYDFRGQAKKPGTNGLAAQNSGTAVLGTQTQQYPITLTAPVQNSALASPRPLIQGTGIPGKQIVVIIASEKTQTGKVTVDKNGNWQYTPTALSAGKQNITMTTVDDKNKPVVITRQFTILKSGTQVLGDATPSASLTPTILATVSPTLASTISATPTEIIEAEPMPDSGSILPTILLMFIGISLITGGAVTFIR